MRYVFRTWLLATASEAIFNKGACVQYTAVCGTCWDLWCNLYRRKIRKMDDVCLDDYRKQIPHRSDMKDASKGAILAQNKIWPYTTPFTIIYRGSVSLTKRPSCNISNAPLASLGLIRDSSCYQRLTRFIILGSTFRAVHKVIKFIILYFDTVVCYIYRYIQYM